MCLQFVEYPSNWLKVCEVRSEGREGTYSTFGANTACSIYPHILGSDLTALVELSVLLKLEMRLDVSSEAQELENSSQSNSWR